MGGMHTCTAHVVHADLPLKNCSVLHVDMRMGGILYEIEVAEVVDADL